MNEHFMEALPVGGQNTVFGKPSAVNGSLSIHELIA